MLWGWLLPSPLAAGPSERAAVSLQHGPAAQNQQKCPFFIQVWEKMLTAVVLTGKVSNTWYYTPAGLLWEGLRYLFVRSGAALAVHSLL